jgi:endonuclease G, mitochondrial
MRRYLFPLGLSCILWFGIVLPVSSQAPSSSTSTTPTDTTTLKAQAQANAEEFPSHKANIRSAFRLKTKEAGATPEQLEMIAENCLWGMPKHLPGVDLGPTRYVYHQGYVLEHSNDSKTPLWVSEHCTRDALSGHLKRTNPFRPEPQLQGFPRSELSDYRGSGFDRGHMAPNGNQTVDDELRTDTFFLSNIVPQVGKKFNQSVWADLEDTVRKWTKSREETWIITGGLFYDPKEEDERTANGLVEVDRIGDDDVAVPTHLFKIIVGHNPDSKKWESITFVMPNRNYPHRDIDFGKFIRSVRWVEERAGIDLFPEVVAKNPGHPEVKKEIDDGVIELWNN